jgi:hypothetical protein
MVKLRQKRLISPTFQFSTTNTAPWPARDRSNITAKYLFEVPRRPCNPVLGHICIVGLGMMAW